ncbi:PepSY-associated TM helix domain-containing protein [Nesterenkonia sandarakina]|uniref:Putative iron-regulated membrane protein n=1 Tax=Nesterenkonia sandarakina TaxID=272918 RepID=A0A7Z0E8A4_9MICC|nr:PepSY domain-containing protein [Nesterenkonia sandarakina]NYJ16259.1 putative iron-regulated membrane protein [Nesterenkonia sandarakina]
MTTDTRATEPAEKQPPSSRARLPHEGSPRRQPPWFAPLLRRLHFYAGIFVGPFILIAAATGALYAFSPQIEAALYGDVLEVDGGTDPLPLADQVEAAQLSMGEGAAIAAVRPAAEPGETTRVMFNDEDLAASQHMGVFVDPDTAEVLGQEAVYGSSGSLPFRFDVAQAHRHLFLGDWGRLYSELAASWLAVVVLAGLGLWVSRWVTARRRRSSTTPVKGLLVPDHSRKGYARTRSWHASVGIWLSVGALFLAATGITWSTYGGANVSDARAALSWETPSVQTELEGSSTGDAHAGHDHGSSGSSDAPATGAIDPSLFDEVLTAGRAAGFDSTQLEIITPAEEGQAWSMRDVSLALPAPEVHSVSVNPENLQAHDVLYFDDFPFVAKLAQWGIWLHMGTLFGLANQVLLLGISLGIIAMVIFGYVMWWQRRPRHSGKTLGPAPARGAFRRAPWWGKLLTVGVLGGIGWFLPVLGVSLVVFLVIDLLLGLRARRGASVSRVPGPS